MCYNKRSRQDKWGYARPYNHRQLTQTSFPAGFPHSARKLAWQPHTLLVLRRRRSATRPTPLRRLPILAFPAIIAAFYVIALSFPEFIPCFVLK